MARDTQGDYPINLHLFYAVANAVIAIAARDKKTPQTVIEEFVVRAVLDEPTILPDLEHKRLSAEITLMQMVHQTALEFLSTRWDEDTTCKIFEKIESDYLAIYTSAVGGNPYKGGNPIKSRINKQIGARVRVVLGAEVWKSANGTPEKGSVSGGLIRSYTKLRRV
jgi:hypothetical protein